MLKGVKRNNPINNKSKTKKNITTLYKLFFFIYNCNILFGLLRN